jgi:hypothetical protein
LDNDGYQDLFVTVEGGPNRLYRNNGNGTFSIITGEATGSGENAVGATICDINGDHLLDIYVVNRNAQNLAYINNGSWSFTESAAGYGVDGGTADHVSAICMDFNMDGFNELFVPVSGGQNQFFTLSGTTYVEAATAYGIAGSVTNYANTIAGDVNNDGYPDIYVLNSDGVNLLYINNGPTAAPPYSFTEAGGPAGVAGAGSDNSIAAVMADFDNNGWKDIYVVKFAGGSNRLYMNNGDGTFTDGSTEAGVGFSGMGFGAAAIDHDNDGDMDIYVVNGGDNLFLQNLQDTANFLKVKLLGTDSNMDAVGARVTITPEDSGSPIIARGWKTDGMGRSQDSGILHFGLPVTVQYRVTAYFPTGAVRVTDAVSTGQTIILREPGTVLGATFDAAQQGTALISTFGAGATPHVHLGPWGKYGTMGYWIGEDSAYATANGWLGGAGYGSNWNDGLLMTGIDLRDMWSATLNLQGRYQVENGFDFGYIEIRVNNGPWVRLGSFTGEKTIFGLVGPTDLSAYVGNIVDVRLRFKSDSSFDDQDGNFDTTMPGAVYIDNILLEGN